MPILVLHLDPPQPRQSFAILDELGRNAARVLRRRALVCKLDSDLVDVARAPIPQMEEKASHAINCSAAPERNPTGVRSATAIIPSVAQSTLELPSSRFGDYSSLSRATWAHSSVTLK
jgi:hypothetical protein